MEFPYGKAPLAILILCLGAGATLLYANLTAKAQQKPDLVLATFTKDHAGVYGKVMEQFERDNHCKIQIQVVDQKALQNRLESAMEAGAEVPDMIELLDGTMGVFTKGPLEDVQFRDLTDLIHAPGPNSTPSLYDRMVQSRFGKWSSRGHIFALPHDVHPAFLCYRADLVEQLGINVDELTTWDKFAEVGRKITRESMKDGVPQHYMIDLASDGSDMLRMLMLQRGGRLLDEKGEAVFDSDAAVEAVCWYAKATRGDDRFAFAANWGQTLAKAMREGICLFYICPDWRTQQFQNDVPDLYGKLKIMPLPAWYEGGPRTSTWGGTGLAFPKSCRNFDLAWKLAMYLYCDPEKLANRFTTMNILPPLKEAWTQPEFHEPRPFYGGQKIGEYFLAAAPNVPEETVTAYINNARDKFSEAYIDTAIYYEDHVKNGGTISDEELRGYAKAALTRCANQVRELIHRNVFLSKDNKKQEASAK